MQNENDTLMEKDDGNMKDSADKKDNIRYEITEWDDAKLNLDTCILRGIYGYGFEKPSPIQKKGLYPLTFKKKNGRHHDIIAQAQSGTGKTGCFVVGMLQNIDY